jgi:hypothetical protein
MGDFLLVNADWALIWNRNRLWWKYNMRFWEEKLVFLKWFF